MGYRFGRKSKQRLAQVHNDLQFLCNKVIQIIDFKIIEGHRGRKRQNQLFVAKVTKVQFPDSNHNSIPSLAIDIYPYPVILPDIKKSKKEYAKQLARFYYLVGTFKGVALENNIKIRVGADWDGDGEILDQKFDDLPHIEILLEKKKK